MITTSRTSPLLAYFAHPLALVESDDIGNGTRIWAFAHVMSGARVGKDCNLCDHCFVESGATLGDHVTVKNGVCIWDRVSIGDFVFVGPNAVFTNDPNPRAAIKKNRDQLAETVVREHATIGANATIVCGVEIGRYAFVGAGAVIIRPVLDFALMVGNPARHIGWMCACGHKLPLHQQAHDGFRFVCSHCRRSFIFAGGRPTFS